MHPSRGIITASLEGILKTIITILTGVVILIISLYLWSAEEVYQSVQSYQAKAVDELSFDVGVMLKVVEKTLDGWWLVR